MDNKMSRLIFYRQSDANFRSVTLSIDDSIVGSLAHGAFIVADIAPGDHRLSAWVRYTPIGEFATNINVSAGETYYIRASHRAERMLYPCWVPSVSPWSSQTLKASFNLRQSPRRWHCRP